MTINVIQLFMKIYPSEMKMKLFAPSYYNKFKCLAEQCKHNCCIGWEIDIDSETLAYYKNIKGPLGKRLKNGIFETETSAQFILTEDERCPFLNEKGLCDIITELGESSLCNICADHPRFRNYFSDRVETGIGLCCEGAADIILNTKEKADFILLDDDGGDETASDGEKEFFTFRKELFSIITDRSVSVRERIKTMLNYTGVSIGEKTNRELAEIYLKLERLDSEWEEKLNGLINYNGSFDLPCDENIEIAFEQLAVYFLQRQLPIFFENSNDSAGVIFTAVSVKFIMALCSVVLAERNKLTVDDIAQIARMYSAEIEYSDENTEALIEMIGVKEVSE